MPVVRRVVSVSQFAELMGVEPQQVIAVERQGSSLVLVLEPEETEMAGQLRGTLPQLTTGGKAVGSKGGKGGKMGTMKGGKKTTPCDR
jgi:hypothetical protein